MTDNSANEINIVPNEKKRKDIDTLKSEVLKGWTPSLTPYVINSPWAAKVKRTDD